MQRDTNDLLNIGTYRPYKVWNFSAQPLILISPNGEKNIVAGSVCNVMWKTHDDIVIDNVLLEYSTDNGQNWNYIDSVLNTGSYDWCVPLVDLNRCLVRVTDLNDPTTSDTSYKVFLIVHPADFDTDGDLDFDDFIVLAESWNGIKGQAEYNSACDISDPIDGIIDYRDLSVFSSYWLVGKK